MAAKKKRVLLTGASGSMGGQAFKELLRRRDKCDIVLLLRPSKQNREAFGKYDGQPGVTVVWGDLCNPDDVLKAVNGIDHVLHPAALIAPEADGKPITAVGAASTVRVATLDVAVPQELLTTQS